MGRRPKDYVPTNTEISPAEVSCCALCGEEEPSSPRLPYYRKRDYQCRICGFFESSHTTRGTEKSRGTHMLDGHAYDPYLPNHDSHWCGCRMEMVRGAYKAGGKVQNINVAKSKRSGTKRTKIPA